MKKEKAEKAKRRARRQRRWAALLIALMLTGGAAALRQTAAIMAEETRCGQAFAAVTPREGALDFTILGQQGSVPYARWGEEWKANLTALPAAGRLLLWGSHALKTLLEQDFLPILDSFMR